MTFAEYFEGLKHTQSKHDDYDYKHLHTKAEFKSQAVVSQTVVTLQGIGGYHATMQVGLDCKPYMDIRLHNGLDENGCDTDEYEAYMNIDLDDNDLLAIYAMVHMYFNDDCKKKVIELVEQRQRESNQGSIAFINHADFLNMFGMKE